MNRHRHSRCHYKRNSGSTPAGTNNPPHWRAYGATKPQVAHHRPLQSAPAGPHSHPRHENENGVRPPGAAGHRRPDKGWNVAPWLGSNSSPSPAWLGGASSTELEDGFHPQKLEEAGRQPTRMQAPARFSPPSTWWSPSWVTTGEGMQSGCLMKILEAERWLKGTNFREVAFLQRRQDESNASAPHPGARKVEERDA
jgi:hypothetical protein